MQNLAIQAVFLTLLFTIPKLQMAECRTHPLSANLTGPRNAQLVQVLRKGRGLEVLEAAENLALLECHDKETVSALLEAIRRGSNGDGQEFESKRLEVALASSGPLGASAVLKTLKAIFPLKGTGDSQVVLLINVLGRFEQGAKEANSFLKELLNNPKTSPKTKVLLHVVLASIEGPCGGWKKRILQNLRNPDTRQDTVDAMFNVGTCKWITPEIVKELENKNAANVGKPTLGESGFDNFDNIVCGLLGVPGNKAISFSGPLRKKQKELLVKEDLQAISVTLVLARIDPDRMDEDFKRLFRNISKLATNRRLYYFALIETAYGLMDDRMVKHLAQMLEDPDPKVAGSAATFLWFAGLSAKEAFTPVLKFVRSKANVASRIRAIDVLARITPFAQLGDLEAAAKVEKDLQVRQRLQLTIGKIQTIKAFQELPQLE